MDKKKKWAFFLAAFGVIPLFILALYTSIFHPWMRGLDPLTGLLFLLFHVFIWYALGTWPFILWLILLIREVTQDRKRSRPQDQSAFRNNSNQIS